MFFFLIQMMWQKQIEKYGEMMFDSLFLTSLISTCKILIARERPVSAGRMVDLLTTLVSPYSYC